MDKRILSINALPISWNGREFEVKSKASLSLGEVSIEKEEQTKEQDGLIV